MTAAMWRPPRGHCAATLSCPNVCACGLEVKAELEAQKAALAACQDDSGTQPQLAPQSPPAIDSGRLRTIYGLVAAAVTTRGNR